jgi:putative DNA-invertase from lambdoid prophage Rac
MHGLTPAGVVEEGVSGSVPVAERPAAGPLFALLRKGDVVIAPKLDRLFRSALDALKVVEDLKKRVVSLHLLDLGGDRGPNENPPRAAHARMGFFLGRFSSFGARASARTAPE